MSTETMTTPREYLDKAMTLLGTNVIEEAIGALEEASDDARDPDRAEKPDHRFYSGLAGDLEGVYDALTEVHTLVDNYLAETAGVGPLADLVLDVERGVRPWSDLVAMARRIS